jgi:hypothetical protein
MVFLDFNQPLKGDFTNNYVYMIGTMDQHDQSWVCLKMEDSPRGYGSSSGES